MLKKILLGLAAVFVVMQFIRPERNESGDDTHHFTKKYPVSTEVAIMLKTACNDCHSNKTNYPWYANVQPFAWFLDHHVKDGKKHLNFSAFTHRKIAYQNHKFEEIIEMVEKKEMPLPSYTWLGLHPEANLSDAQRALLVNWAKAQMDSLKAQYPADSLKLPRRK